MSDKDVEFDRLVTPRFEAAGRCSFEVPDGWQQGRGAFGGLVLAMLVRAAEASVADPERPLRSLTGELVGPVRPGAAVVAVEVLRAGTGVTTLAARLAQDGEVQAHAVAAFGKARPTYAVPPRDPPAPPPWREVAVAPMTLPFAPTFAQHVEYRMTGAMPHAGGSEETSGWVRLRRPGIARDAALVIAMLDCFWPALFVSSGLRPVATLAFASAHLASLTGLDPDAPLFYRGRMLAGSDGYGVELREIWGEDGRLVAINQQTIVIMR